MPPNRGMGTGWGWDFLGTAPKTEEASVGAAVCTLVGVAVGVADATGVIVGVKNSTKMLLVPQADSSAARAAAANTARVRLIESRSGCPVSLPYRAAAVRKRQPSTHLAHEVRVAVDERQDLVTAGRR